MGVSKLLPNRRPGGSQGGSLGGSHEEVQQVPDGCRKGLRGVINPTLNCPHLAAVLEIRHLSNSPHSRSGVGNYCSHGRGQWRGNGAVVRVFGIRPFASSQAKWRAWIAIEENEQITNLLSAKTEYSHSTIPGYVWRVLMPRECGGAACRRRLHRFNFTDALSSAARDPSQ